MPNSIDVLVTFNEESLSGRYFPHQVADLELALPYMALTQRQSAWHWEKRYIVLLWLSLIVMIPFDLSQFDAVKDSGTTFQALEQAGLDNYTKAGLQRDAATLLLARLYSR